MFSKLRENKGFKVVELMIVVAVIGIVAAFAVPHYHPQATQQACSDVTVTPCCP